MGDASDGVFLKKWLAPILRNLADTPERMAELDVNEGIVPLIEMQFHPPGTLLTPVFPAPTNARTFVILRLLGVLAGVIAKAVDGRMPADQETIRYTGVYGDDLEGRPYLMREVLGGSMGGRYYADGEDTIHVVPDSRNLPTEFTEARFPFRVESLSLAVDSGGAGQFRGGLGYEKQIRMLKDGHFMSIADRSILACWGVRGGKAGQPFQVTIDPGGPNEREVDALADAEPVVAGEVIRIRTTGGGGWGNPLERDPALVVRDVVWRKVSPEAALSAGTASCSPGRSTTATRCRTTRPPPRPSAAGGRLPRTCSSTAAPATPGSPAAPTTPTSTSCEPTATGREAGSRAASRGRLVPADLGVVGDRHAARWPGPGHRHVRIRFPARGRGAPGRGTAWPPTRSGWPTSARSGCSSAGGRGRPGDRRGSRRRHRSRGAEPGRGPRGRLAAHDARW